MKLSKLLSTFLSLVAILVAVSCSTTSEEIDEINYKVKQEYLAYLSESNCSLYKESVKSVVSVLTYENNAYQGLGSGFIYYEDNEFQYIITNYHVIDGGESYKVISYTGQVKSAILLGGDESYDVALLRCRILEDTNVVKFNNEDYRLIENPKVGEEVYAIGNPGTLDNRGTIHTGIVSRVNANPLNQSFDKAEYAIQIDLALNPGNSGGPLFNMNGEVVGVNTYAISQSEGVSYDGLNYSLSIQDVLCIVESIRKTGSFSRTSLGSNYYMEVNNLTIYERGSLGIEEDFYGGILVYSFGNNNKLNIPRYSIISESNGMRVNTLAEFRRSLYMLSPGDKVNIKYYPHNEGNIGYQEETSAEFDTVVVIV